MVLPASCASCGSIDNPDGFVDFGISFEFYGVLYFCHDCVFEATQVFDENPFDALKADLEQTKEQLTLVTAINQRLENSLDSFALARVSERGLDSNKPNSNVLASSGSKGHSSSSSASTASVKGADDSRTNQPATRKRSTNTTEFNGDDLLGL